MAAFRPGDVRHVWSEMSESKVCIEFHKEATFTYTQLFAERIPYYNAYAFLPSWLIKLVSVKTWVWIDMHRHIEGETFIKGQGSYSELIRVNRWVAIYDSQLLPFPLEGLADNPDNLQYVEKADIQEDQDMEPAVIEGGG